MNIYTTQEILQLEQSAMETTPAFELMQRAGQASFDCLKAHWPNAKKIAIIAGQGNNAGDGYVLARLALLAGLDVELWQLGDATDLSALAAKAAQMALDAHLSIRPYEWGVTFKGDVIVDALLGVGVHGTLKREYYEAIDDMNASPVPVLALDVPSGLDPNTGTILGHAVKADVTITFFGIKRGMVTGDGTTVCGSIVCHTLGFELNTPVKHRKIDWVEVKNFLAPRPLNCHKKQLGRVLIVGGNLGYAGAVHMAGIAAMRMGASVVTIATHPLHAAWLDVTLPEVMCRGINKAKVLDEFLEEADVVIVGPGLGVDAWGTDILKKVLTSDLPMVVDAEALHFIAQKKVRRENWVLTPHPGEAAILLKDMPGNIQRDRYAAIEKIQKQYGGVCVLKGAGTLVLGDDGVVHVCREGNPGMATAGMGDVLAGVIGGLLAQGLSLEEAANLGVCVHARAADAAAVSGRRGLMATDLYPYLRQLINE